MSNECLDWLRDRIIDVLLDANLIDRATEVCDSPIDGHMLVYGLKNNAKVAFSVWWNHIEKEWQYECREINI